MYSRYKNKLARAAYMKRYNREWKIKNHLKLKKLRREWNRKYRLSHREVLNKNNKRWRSKKENQLKIIESRKKYLKTPSAFYSRYKISARKRGYKFLLTIDFFIKILSFPCAYCGAKEKIGIDRMDNTMGYVPENCIACCSNCNYLKRGLSLDSLRKLAQIYRVLSSEKGQDR